MLHCNGKGGQAAQLIKNLSQTGNGCLVHPDTRSLWWIQPDPGLRISWPRSSDSHPDVIDVLSDDIDVKVDDDDDNSVGESHDSFNPAKVSPNIKNKSPCCSRESLHHRHHSHQHLNKHHQHQHHRRHHHHHKQPQHPQPPFGNGFQQQQPIFRPICPTPPPKSVRHTFPPLTRQNCVDVQINYPHKVVPPPRSHTSCLERVPTFDYPKTFRQMSVEKLPYLSPHLPCQQVNPVCTRFDSLTSSSSSCCRRPDSSCSCQPGERRFCFHPVEPAEPVYDRVVSWLEMNAPSRTFSKLLLIVILFLIWSEKNWT